MGMGLSKKDLVLRGSQGALLAVHSVHMNEFHRIRLRNAPTAPVWLGLVAVPVPGNKTNTKRTTTLNRIPVPLTLCFRLLLFASAADEAIGLACDIEAMLRGERNECFTEIRAGITKAMRTCSRK